MELTKKVDRKVMLSTLWIVLIINMIYADIYSLIVEIAKGGRMEDIPGDVKIMMAFAAIVTNIPVVMIFLSRILKYAVNRYLNMGVGIFTIIYVWEGMSSYPHYIIIATIETVLALVIIRMAWKWKGDEKEE